ncbi:hypothetical protein I6N95_10465 [Vagococcus sp. BWB3-3]|uniref:Uncharacterized protein n=1 Tax=Vagococcus allomyrinae TaxID=2794353 RepID=A0A940SWJ1_9ENTE|nr:hypothetical protein [Vagococcus allomyrinae]MBP1041428.1 hypothetical protein [Vagococcus allomyrinae]
MDTALILKKKRRLGETISKTQIDALLGRSKVVEAIVNADYRTDRFTGLRKLEFLLTELSEIPDTIGLEKTSIMLNELITHTKQGEGFSLSDGEKGVLACHQAMITLIMIRFDQKQLAEHGVDWIMKYQITQRGQVCNWRGCDLYQRFGCVGKTPCYDGLVKSMKALAEFQRAYGKDADIQQKLTAGITYILEHEVYKTMDRTATLGSDITKLFYPYPYRTNLIELLSLLQQEGYLSDERVKDARAMLASKRESDGGFKAEKIFMQSSWVPFDKLKETGEWLTDEIESILNDPLVKAEK